MFSDSRFRERTITKPEFFQTTRTSRIEDWDVEVRAGSVHINNYNGDGGVVVVEVEDERNGPRI